MRRFHERIGLKLEIDEARRRFMNRVANSVYPLIDHLVREQLRRRMLRGAVAYDLGERSGPSLQGLANGDFARTLEVLEAVQRHLRPEDRLQVRAAIAKALDASEIDLGIRWSRDAFSRSGAPPLDAAVVDDVLGRLERPELESVRVPFAKALAHLLRSTNHHELRADAVTDAYEALESMAKIATGKNGDLSKIQEQFVRELAISSDLKPVLKAYIAYAGNYRHGSGDTPKLLPSDREAEAFVYLTGVFLRLATS